jgi:hypothetical protein
MWNAERAPSMRRWLGVSSVLLLERGWEGAWFERSSGGDGLRCAALCCAVLRCTLARLAGMAMSKAASAAQRHSTTQTCSFPSPHPS